MSITERFVIVLIAIMLCLAADGYLNYVDKIDQQRINNNIRRF